MDIQEKLERTRIINLTTQHIFILRKLDKLCQELSDMDTKEFIKVHDNLIKEKRLIHQRIIK